MLISYDPTDVNLTIADQNVQGFADNSFITIKRDAEQWKAKADRDGGVTRSLSHNALGKITFTLTQFEDYNVIMQEHANNGDKFFIQVEHKGSMWSGTGWIEKLPDVQYGAEGGNREWVVAVAQLKFAQVTY